MNTETIAQFDVLDTEILASVEAGDNSSYCKGQVFGRILTKQLLRLPIQPSDYICQ